MNLKLYVCELVGSFDHPIQRNKYKPRNDKNTMTFVQHAWIRNVPFNLHPPFNHIFIYVHVKGTFHFATRPTSLGSKNRTSLVCTQSYENPLAFNPSPRTSKVINDSITCSAIIVHQCIINRMKWSVTISHLCECKKSKHVSMSFM